MRTSPAELLRQARDAKTDGRGGQAIALYRRLQREFPASSEALVGSVPLGRLLLDRGSARAALAHFNRYLGGAPSGALVPEALYGRAQAQARLGDRGAERASWQRLLSDFPDSPYSASARRRLSELP
jgi:TolA-binding protein